MKLDIRQINNLYTGVKLAAELKPSDCNLRKFLTVQGYTYNVNGEIIEFNKILNKNILKENKSVSKTDCNNYCNRELKKEYEWLKEVDKFALMNAIYNMDSAYQKFFKEHAGYPKFKSRHDNHKSYTTNFTNGNIAADFESGKIKLPKLGKMKAELHREFDGQIKSATISQLPSGKYYVSALVETEHMELPHMDKNIGLDLSIKDLCITSDGKKYTNPKIIKKYGKKLAKLQRQLPHKEKRSKNYYKQKKKIALCH